MLKFVAKKYFTMKSSVSLIQSPFNFKINYFKDI